MGIGSFFKLPQYNVFDYKPRFYDPQKEERKEKLNDLRKSLGKKPLDADEIVKPGSSIKGSFRPKMRRTSFRSRSSTIRLVLIIAVLLFLSYLILNSDFSSVVKFLGK
ncbi:MAG TPA: hypothetical protein PLL66_08160 [Bacteroidales bacterium]|nr:hypothetical protein [Bacteroidales bacterium]